MASLPLLSPNASQGRSGNSTSNYNDLLANDVTFDQQQIDQIANNQYFQDENDQEWWDQVDTSGLQYDATLFPAELNDSYHDQTEAPAMGDPQHHGFNTFNTQFTSPDFYTAGSAPADPTLPYAYTQQPDHIPQNLMFNTIANYADPGAAENIPPSLFYPPTDLTQFDFPPSDASAACNVPIDYTQVGQQMFHPLQAGSPHTHPPPFLTPPLNYAGTLPAIAPMMHSRPANSPSPAVPSQYQLRNSTQPGDQGELAPQSLTVACPEGAKATLQRGPRHVRTKDDYSTEPFSELSAKEILLGENENVKVLSHEIDGPTVLKVAMEYTNQEIHGYTTRLQRQERLHQQTLGSITKRISNSLEDWAGKAGCDSVAAADKFMKDWRDERMKQLAARRKTGNALNPRNRPKMRASAKARQARTKSKSPTASG